MLLTAREFGVFTRLGTRRMTGAELGLHPRGIHDFFDALLSMGFLEREGDGPEATYRHTAAGLLYLDRNSPRYVGGMLEMLNARLFRFWDDLPTALRTGKPRNEVKHGQKGFDFKPFETLCDVGGATGLFFGDAFDFDFRRFEVIPPAGASSAAIAYE